VATGESLTAISGRWGSVGPFSSLDSAVGCSPPHFHGAFDKEAGTEAATGNRVPLWDLSWLMGMSVSACRTPGSPDLKVATWFLAGVCDLMWKREWVFRGAVSIAGWSSKQTVRLSLTASKEDGGAKRLGVRRESWEFTTTSGSLSSSRRRHFANAWVKAGFQNAGIEAADTAHRVMLTGFHVTTSHIQGFSFQCAHQSKVAGAPKFTPPMEVPTKSHPQVVQKWPTNSPDTLK
jgi:hypothetical protein